MRIIAGTAKGLRLKAPRGREVRPTADRVKEALFSILGASVTGTVAIDLFAGSGALGIEALSRGASHCIFVDNDRRHLSLIKENLERAGFAGRSRLIGQDVQTALRFLSREQLAAGLIFMDPPYRSPLIPAVLQSIHRLNLLSAGGLVVIEHALDNRAWSDEYPSKKQRQYGSTLLTWLERSELGAAASAEKQGQPDRADEVEDHSDGRQ